jgi:hypothetical protein
MTRLPPRFLFAILPTCGSISPENSSIMVAHLQRDYTLFFEEEEIELLNAGYLFSSELINYNEKVPLTIELKTGDEIYALLLKLKETSYGPNNPMNHDSLVFLNEANLAIVHWDKNVHHLYFEKTWFIGITDEMLRGKYTSQTIRWGAEKITILTGDSSEARKFKAFYGPDT